MAVHRTDAPTTGRRWTRSRRTLRGALTAVTVLAAITLAPGQATAGTTYATNTVTFADNSVTPLLDCVGRNADGSYTAVLGYANTSSTVKTIAVGPWNSIWPTRYNGAQPTTFTTGVQHGAFSVKLSRYAYAYGWNSWFLDGRLVFIGATFASGVPACTQVQMPAQGNDTGGAIALLVAGVVGVLLVVRLRRRTPAPATAATPGEGRTDA